MVCGGRNEYCYDLLRRRRRRQPGKKNQKKEKIPHTKCTRAKAGNGEKRQSFVSETQFVIIYRPYMSGVGEGLLIRVYRQSERGKEHVFGQQK